MREFNYGSEDVMAVTYAAEQHARDGGVNAGGSLRDLGFSVNEDAIKIAEDAFVAERKLIEFHGKKVFFADCDQFDNSRTGYYATDVEAIEAFWLENHFSTDEHNRAKPYTREIVVDADAIETAKILHKEGSPSPVLGMNLR